ncbi:hypothetical protein, partial [Frankia sp. AgB1.8]|uniref:hypothetical protein n=1 Tax=Frankia sp. AgB1.8 TaxID=2792839 RepID=UPI001EE44DD7
MGEPWCSLPRGSLISEIGPGTRLRDRAAPRFVAAGLASTDGASCADGCRAAAFAGFDAGFDAVAFEVVALAVVAFGVVA